MKKNECSSEEKSKEHQGKQKFNESERRVIFIGIEINFHVGLTVIENRSLSTLRLKILFFK